MHLIDSVQDALEHGVSCNHQNFRVMCTCCLERVDTAVLVGREVLCAECVGHAAH